MTFEMPIWIAPPAKVTHMNVIQRIIASVYDNAGNIDKDVFDPDKVLVRRVMTLLSYGVVLVGNKLKLVKQEQGLASGEYDVTTEVYGTDKVIWRNILNQYGTITNGVSQIRLETEAGTEVIGTVAYDPTDETQLLFNVIDDTIPTNTLTSINAIIDPFKSNIIDLLFNNDGTYKVTAGTRFLILSDIGSQSSTEFAKAWTPNNVPVVAHANDIIQYDGSRWLVSFNSRDATTAQYVTNTTTNVQYRWDGENWVKSYEGLYREASWRLVL
jgi:hypothetical protein